ncbi:MAG: class I SAM-dependent methyltransferase [Parasphingopyxis sp.]|uniref:class I SAM-dependent methyltransferase n=1 Tax=Parasphingopyxis sp. TaxID=1920299 RepID=UPI003FA087BE
MSALDPSGYHESRLAADPKRDIVWKALWRYHFSKHIGPEDCVLDLGAGYGEFINNVRAKRRIALDLWDRMPLHVGPDVEPIVGPVSDLSAIEDNSVDYAFSSNLFEHISQDDLAATLAQLKSKLKAGGTLTTLQPNYRYASREYFDDYTHVTVWSHIGLADFLTAHGYEVLEVHPRFLPLTVKSRLPTWPILVGAYLASPVKPMGKQMLLVARPKA